MARKAKRPLNKTAVKKADDAFYAAHPELVKPDGTRIPLRPGDPRCKEWMDLYEANGGPVCDDQPSSSQPLRTTCPCQYNENTQTEPPLPVPQEDTPPSDDPNEEQVHVLVKIAYDPTLEESWDDKCKLFTTADNGGTYCRTVALSNGGLTQKESWHVIVLFKDVIPDHPYSCFLDLGGNAAPKSPGGHLLFYNHMITESMSVPGLPRDHA